MKRRAILHIGNHKAGSSAIQAALLEHQRPLNLHGLHLLTTNFEGIKVERGGLNGWVCCSENPSIRPGLAAAMDKAGLGSVVVSAENFAFVNDDDSLKHLSDDLNRYFDHVDVVCYLRRQDRHIVSHIQQCAKPTSSFDRSHLGFNPWMGTNDLSPNAISYLDYGLRLSKWKKYFGQEAIRVRVYDRNKLEGGDAAKDFFQLLGVPYEGRSRLVNRSWGFEKTVVGHILAELKAPKEHWTRIVSNIHDTAPYDVSRETSRKWIEMFEDSNFNVSKEYLGIEMSLFDPELGGIPDALPEWTSLRTENVIRSLLNQML